MTEFSGVGLAVDTDGEVYLSSKDTLRVLIASGSEDQALCEWISGLIKPEPEVEGEESFKSDIDLTQIEEPLEKQPRDDETWSKDRTIAKLKEDVAKLQRQLFQIEPKFGLDIPDGGRSLRFLLIKKNSDIQDNFEEHFQYYGAVVMKRSVEDKIESLKRRYPELQVLLDLEEDASTKLLDRLEDLEQVTVCENHLGTTMPEEELLSALRKVHKDSFGQLTDNSIQPI